jgi:hypothetical protein
MLRALPLLLAAPLIIGYGVIEGRWTSRWTPSPEIREAADRLQRVPLALGEWKAKALEMDPREVEVGQISGYLYRVYVRPATKDVVTVLLVCGRPGPVSVHTPDVCYRGLGYAMAGDSSRVAVPAPGLKRPAEFRTAQFRREEGPNPDPLRVFWGWNAAGTWEAPDNPRFAFARFRALYKLYVIHHQADPNEPAEQDAGQDLMNLLLPELERALAPGS